MTGHIFRIAALSLAIALGLAVMPMSDRIDESARHASDPSADTVS